ncbi:MAG: Radical domain protein [Verrucomicrobia bacterium]|jgi:biotin synthase|nr:Radical domain protein [Verrucomicrobiota bacterium]
MLTARGDEQGQWMERASAVRDQRFGRRAFVRAVVEVSNFCRENCEYCGMRRDNKSLHRFRGQAEQLAELVIEHRPASVTDLNIQTGEDPVAVREVVLPLLKILQRETNLGLSVCLGTLSADLYAALQDAGASIYIIKFEIANRTNYHLRHAPGTFDERLSTIRHLAEKGWNVSSGFISGLPGQGIDDVIENLALAASLPLAGCSVSPFIPGESTPLAKETTADVELVLNSMTAMRLMRPDWVIPVVSAMNLADPVEGYRRGWRTGANLATINMTPSDVRGDYLLYKRDRFIMTEGRILKALENEKLQPSEIGLAEHYRQQRELAAA